MSHHGNLQYRPAPGPLKKYGRLPELIFGNSKQEWFESVRSCGQVVSPIVGYTIGNDMSSRSIEGKIRFICRKPKPGTAVQQSGPAYFWRDRPVDDSVENETIETESETHGGQA